MPLALFVRRLAFPLPFFLAWIEPAIYSLPNGALKMIHMYQNDAQMVFEFVQISQTTSRKSSACCL